MSCWTFLNLPADADIRTVKRQYATLLKQCRPDEDPEGFQRLREAYEEALEQCRRRDEGPVEVFSFAPTQSIPPTRPLPDEHAQAETFPVFAAALADPKNTQTKRQRALELLEHISADTLEARLIQASSERCAAEFEEHLLPLCLEPGLHAQALRQWAIRQFQWLSPWQRPDLPFVELHQLLEYLLADAEVFLKQQLASTDPEAFFDGCRQLHQNSWMQALERREAFNRLLAKVLAESPIWSQAVFERVCEQHGWGVNTLDNLCPHIYWPELQRRSEGNAFVREQQRLATLKSNAPAHRAARLLFGGLQPTQRVFFTRRFSEQDWAACYDLAKFVSQRYPECVASLPEGDAFFWRTLKRSTTQWPMYVGAVIAGCTASIGQFGFKSGVNDLLTGLVFWAAVFAVSTFIVLKCWRPLADLLWRVDAWLTPRVSHRLTPRRPAPMAVLELLPCWLLGGWITACGGWPALLGYALTLQLLAAADRWCAHWFVDVPVANREPRPFKIATMILFVVVGIVAIWAYNSRINLGEDEGLQPWAERACARLPSVVVGHCRPPATHEQWYGPKAQQESQP